jgi:DHA1 family tetracycline resistance protein-like MFS transporter
MTEASSPAARPAALLFIFITVVLDMLALGIIIPVLPKLVEDFLAGDTARAAQVFGVFGTVFALMQFGVSPLLGVLSDSVGRRPLILISNLGLGLDYVLMALAPNLWFLFVGRVISGITAASTTIAGAYVVDVTPPERRASAFGMIGAAAGFGFVLGPAIGGALGQLDPRLPFWFAAVLSLVNFAYGLIVLPESLPRERRTAFAWRKANPFGAFALLRSHPELLGLSGVMLLNFVAHEVLPALFVLYAGYRYDWDQLAVGLALAGVGVGSMIVQGGLVRPLVRRLGERTTLLLGLVCGAAGFAVYGLAPTGGLFLIGLPLSALWGLFLPAGQSRMSRNVAPQEQGRLQGALTALRGVGSLIGPGLFTLVFAASLPDRPGTPFILAAGLSAVAAVIALAVVRRVAQPPR